MTAAVCQSLLHIRQHHGGDDRSVWIAPVETETDRPKIGLVITHKWCES